MSSNAATPVFFDTDPGIDDVMALLYLVASPAVDLLGVSTVFGNASIEDVTANALYVRERLGLNYPVHVGAGVRFDGSTETDYPDFVHGSDGLGDVRGPVAGTPDSDDAVAALAAAIRARPGEVVVLAVGRLTNIANLFQQEPDVVPLLGGLTLMGGAAGWQGPLGNVSPVAEANIFGDAAAADFVFSHDVDALVVGLDVTSQIECGRDWYAGVRDRGGAAGELLWEINQAYLAYHRRRYDHDATWLHDGAAAVAVTHPDLFGVRRGGIRVPAAGPAQGQTIVAPPDGSWGTAEFADLPVHRICETVDAAAVIRALEERLAS